jgi:serine/threonine-protein kinase
VERRLTTSNSVNSMAVWSPQGESLVFTSDRDGIAYNLFKKAASGTGSDEPLLATPTNKTPSQWSRDGRYVVFTGLGVKTNDDLWWLPMEGTDRKPIAFLHSEFSESHGQLSPDSHWMAFISDESGQREVYVRPFPDGDSQFKVSLAGGEQPRWCCDGKELFFYAAGKMMAVTVRAAAGPKPSLELGAPQPLFETRLASSPLIGGFEYDVTPDGKRFVIASPVAKTTSVPPLTVVVNWSTPAKK